MMPRYTWLAATLLAATHLAACAAPEGAGPIKGFVVDLATGKPIAGAVVRVVREGTGGGLANTQTVCISLQTATTDDSGRYEVSKVPAGNHKDIVQDIRAFKPGYVLPGGFKTFYPRESTTISLERFEGSKAEWVSYVLSAGLPVCGSSEGRWDEYSALLWLDVVRRELAGISSKDLSPIDVAGYEAIEWTYARLARRAPVK